MDQITEQVPAQKKTAKRRKRQAKPRSQKVIASIKEPADDLAGLTPTECCFDCSAERCVISGMNFCGHPAKGGAQPAMQRDPDAMKRYNAGRKKLAHLAAERRS